MRTRTRTRHSLAALVTVATLWGATACAEESPGAAEETNNATPSPGSEEAGEDAGNTTSGNAADVPLTEPINSTSDSPLWAMPMIQGWSMSAEMASGVSQITKDGSEAMVTTYQMNDPDAASDEAGGRAWLDNYHAEIAANPQASDVTGPDYSTSTVPSTRGALEFVAQELTYVIPDGTTYRSFFLARSIDGHLFAVQYAAPEDEWSRQEWEEVGERGFQLAL